MGFLDKIKKAAKGKNKQLKAGLDKAEKMAHDKLPDKYDKQIDKGADAARKAVDSIDPQASPATPTTPSPAPSPQAETPGSN
ncbi:MAG: antitoxin [Ilumatobacteraceae bacterium]